MRISDWSSDVCSSDLRPCHRGRYSPRWRMGLLSCRAPRALCRRLYVRQGKIIALEQQRLVGRLGQRIGKAVAKVQARFVAALAEIEKRLSRQFAMIERHRFDRDAGAAKEGFGLAHPFGT